MIKKNSWKNSLRYWQKIEKSIGITIAVVLFFSLSLIGFAQGAIAETQATPQAHEETMFRSLHSLRDQNNRTWQLVFFDVIDFAGVDRKEIKQIHLRLVAFPGLGLELERTPLQIEAKTGQSWKAPDLSATAVTTGELPADTGEFDLYKVMQELQDDTVIDLQVAMTSGNSARLTIPVAIVREWRSLLDQR
jgi:hypothetical protein